MKTADEDLKTALDRSIQEAVAWSEEHSSADRDRNYRYYLGKMPPGPTGRSQASSWDVFETVESALPDLLEIFLGADNIAEYVPVGEEDEEYCDQATDYINYIVQKQNPGFLLFTTWIKDALLSKLGVVRAYWAEIDSVKDREYTGVSEDWLTKLLDNPDAEVITSEQYDDPIDLAARAQAEAAINTLAPDIQAQVIAGLQQPVAQLYNIKLRETKRAGRVYIDNIQPENFVITPRAKTIETSDLCGELKTMTRSEMIERGYNKKKVKEVTGIESVVLEEVGISQEADDETMALTEALIQQSTDESTEQVLVFDGFIKLDYSGDGLAEWRHVVHGGNIILVNESAECPDFVTMTPILIPHRLMGLALADIVAPIQEQSTAMTRQYLDSLVLANNPRTYALENQVNMDDLLNNRIGGTVRIKSINAVGPLVTTNVAGSALEGVEFMDSRRELRTGITRYNQGLDADSLNKTATGVTKIMSAGDRRKVMMARIMAETGIKDLFKLLLKLVVENQDKAATIRLRNEWVEIDPSPWSPDMDVTVETGLGTGDKSELIAVLQFILTAQKEAMTAELPIVDLKNIYNTLDALLKAAGIKGINKYFKDPTTIQPEEPKEPPKDPALALAEATVEAERIKAEVALKRIEADVAIRSKDLEIKLIDLRLKEMDLETKRAEAVHAAQSDNRTQDRADAELIGKALTGGA